MKRVERNAVRKLEAAEHHLALAFELLHEASICMQHAKAIGDNVAHLNDEIRREIRIFTEFEKARRA